MTGPRSAVPNDAESLVSIEDVEAARHRIADVRRTPLLPAESLGHPLGLDLQLKAEVFQQTGSFKARGVLNRLKTLPPEAGRRGFVAFSAGNHGAALAWAAARMGATATVVMPATAVPAKVDAIRAYGGEPVLTTGDLVEEARRLEGERGLVMIHPFDDPAIIAGQGTVGLELLEEAGAFDAVVAPVGGGGLISGLAVAVRSLRPEAQIIGVEPSGADAMARSLAAGHAVRLERTATIADGLAAPHAGTLTYAHVRRLVDRVVVIDDDAIVRALRLLVERAKLVVEPAGAAAVAAILCGAARFRSDARVVCVVSGGNIGLDTLRRLI
jgi:threonine dehydratase